MTDRSDHCFTHSGSPGGTKLLPARCHKAKTWCCWNETSSLDPAPVLTRNYARTWVIREAKPNKTERKSLLLPRRKEWLVESMSPHSVNWHSTLTTCTLTHQLWPVLVESSVLWEEDKEIVTPTEHHPSFGQHTGKSTSLTLHVGNRRPSKWHLRRLCDVQIETQLLVLLNLPWKPLPHTSVQWYKLSSQCDDHEQSCSYLASYPTYDMYQHHYYT